MAEDAPVAPVEAPQEAPKSEATPNTNSEPEKAPEAKETLQNTITLTDEQRKFIEANGGFDTAFSKLKSAISNPPKEEPKEEAPKQMSEPQPQAQPQEAPKVGEGYITPTEIAAIQYNNMLASEEKYAQIKDYIKEGSFLKDMVGMGMSPVDGQGNLNDRTIRQFLDLKAQTVPAKAPEADASTAAPTVQYTEVGEEFTSRAEAMKVMSEAGHPRHADAVAYLRKELLK